MFSFCNEKVKLPTDGVKSASLLINSRTENTLMKDVQRLCAEELQKLKESNVKTPSKTPKRKQSIPDDKENTPDKKSPESPTSAKKSKSVKARDNATPKTIVDPKVLLFGKAKKTKPLSGLYPLVIADLCKRAHLCRHARLIPSRQKNSRNISIGKRLLSRRMRKRCW